MVNNEDLPDNFSALSIQPNPFSSSINLSLTLDKSNEVAYELFNLQGQRLFGKSLGQLNSGETTINITNLTPWPAGVYFLKIRSGNEFVVRKVVKF